MARGSRNQVGGIRLPWYLAPLMPWPSSEELGALVARFQDGTLPKEAWTHAAHLAVGTWHVWHHGPADSLGRLRASIRALNDAHGTPNTDSRGYHETITRAYVVLIAGLVRAQRDTSSAAECAQHVLASPIAQKDVLLSYYSKERLTSPEARRQWMPPDKGALPEIDG